MTFREAADRESGLCYNIGVQVNLLFDCPKKGASMKQSSNKKSREATAFLLSLIHISEPTRPY